MVSSDAAGAHAAAAVVGNYTALQVLVDKARGWAQDTEILDPGAPACLVVGRTEILGLATLVGLAVMRTFQSVLGVLAEDDAGSPRPVRITPPCLALGGISVPGLAVRRPVALAGKTSPARQVLHCSGEVAWGAPVR